MIAARDEALDVRSLYEELERRLHGRTWSLEELFIGFSQDVGQVGRLMLAHSGTWNLDDEVPAALRHKLAESLWWIFVLARELDVDIDDAFTTTMATLRADLQRAIGK